MPDFLSQVLGPPWRTLDAPKVQGFAAASLLVLLATLFVGVLLWLFHIERIVGIYLIPVLISSIRWGLWPGLFAAVASVVLIDALFALTIKPVFLSLDWEELVRLGVFITVAIVASRLGRSVKELTEKAERAVNETQRRAETEELREALIGSVSHELRTPLSSILGATTVLTSAPAVTGDPKLATMANVVREESARLNNVIQNLLDATRISSEGLKPRFEWAEASDIVNQALERRRPRLGTRTLDVDLAPDLPLVYVDPVMVAQALEQLLDNAAKYSPESEPIRITGRTADGAVMLSVTDRGVGLAPDELARLGERFFRGSRTANTTPGSGFGVWIAKAFLHASGGSLSAASDGADRGATFTIRLPIPAHAPAREFDPHE